jgi:hypothetical protein
MRPKVGQAVYIERVDGMMGEYVIEAKIVSVGRKDCVAAADGQSKYTFDRKTMLDDEYFPKHRLFFDMPALLAERERQKLASELKRALRDFEERRMTLDTLRKMKAVLDESEAGE